MWVSTYMYGYLQHYTGCRRGDNLVLAVGVLALSLVHLFERLVERAPLHAPFGLRALTLGLRALTLSLNLV